MQDPNAIAPKRSFWDMPSTYVLILANLSVIVINYMDGLSLATLMFTYWTQSVFIGIAHFFRINSLKKFDTTNFTMNNQPVNPDDPHAKGCVSLFFLVHYGIFHFVYFIFIIVGSKENGDINFNYALEMALLFAIGQFFSLFREKHWIATHKINIGSLMFWPYFRIIPMHLIILGGAFFKFLGNGDMFVFIMLKFLADIGMQYTEFHIIYNAKPLPGAENMPNEEIMI